jgi:hypothetical protein
MTALAAPAATRTSNHSPKKTESGTPTGLRPPLPDSTNIAHISYAPRPEFASHAYNCLHGSNQTYDRLFSDRLFPRPPLDGVMSTTSKERLQEIVLSLTEPEAEIVWEACSSRPPEEDHGDALGRGLGDVYERRRARAPDSGRNAPG